MTYNFDEVISREGTDALKYDFRKIIFKNENVLPLWVADMDFKTPDFILEAIKKRLDHPILGYTLRGNDFFDSVINWVKKRHDWDIKKNQISFTPGVVPGLALAVQAYTKPGDKIIIQTPVYHPFHSTVKDLGRQLTENQLKEENGQYQIDFEILEKQIDDRTKMFILCNPHNPVGRVWKKEELQKLGEICVKHDLIIIADDIHSDLIIKPNKYEPIAKLSEEIAKRTITFLAPSKTFNLAGLSTSVAICSNLKLLAEFNRTIQDYHLYMGNIFGNIALKTAYNEGEEWLKQLLDYIKGNFDFMVSFLKDNLPQIKVSDLEGTYLAWLDFREYKLSQEKLNDLLINKAGLGFNSGDIFGKTGTGFQRINLACSRKIIEEAMQKLKLAFAER